MSLYFRIENNIGTIEFDLPDSKVNLLTADVLKKLDALLDDLKSNTTSLKALLIVSKKKDVFIAGADIKEIAGITQKQEGEAKSKAGQNIFNKLEDLKIPTVAVIDGVALGGGCELALACWYRIATFNEKVGIGLPEVKLGIVPGFGGTYRLPRVIGLSEGLKMIVSGETISGRQALKVGLVDRLFPQKGLDEYVGEFVEDIKDKKRPARPSPLKKKKGLPAFLDTSLLGQAIVFREATKNVLKKTKGFYPAPLKAIEAVQKTIYLNRERALDMEAKTFAELAVTDISKNLVHVFYLSEKFKKFVPAGAEQIAPKEIRKCAVVGAGIMGGGIAQLLSSKDIATRMKDINYDAIAKGLKAAYKIYESAIKTRRLKKYEANLKMDKITGTIDYSGFQNAEMVIEAVVENMEVKKKVFKEITNVVPEDAILCTNTSALSVTEMAQVVKNPSRMIGLHFFNPVHRMPLVEIIKTDLTSPQTIVTTLQFAKRIGKTPILVKDCCGFLVNRILLAYINEAGYLLQEGGKMEDIDRTMKQFGMPMGPFELTDEVGIDVGYKVLQILYSGLGQRFQPAVIFKQIYEKGYLGKKAGKGFYFYKDGKIGNSNPDIQQIGKPLSSNKLSAGADEKENVQRMVYIMINEAARCLEERVIEDAATVDVGMIMGTGFPPFRGGLLRYADRVGMEAIVGELKRLEDRLQSERFRPCSYLLELQKNKKSFYH